MYLHGGKWNWGWFLKNICPLVNLSMETTMVANVISELKTVGLRDFPKTVQK